MTTDLPTILCGEMSQKYYILFEKITCKRKFTFCFVLFSRPCKEIQDSLGFWIPRRRFRIQIILHLYSVDVGFRIPDFYSCIPDSKAQDSGFYKQKFPGFPHMGRFFYIFLVKVLQVRKHTPISFPEVAILRSATGMLVSLEKCNKGSVDEICYANPSVPSWHDL